MPQNLREDPISNEEIYEEEYIEFNNKVAGCILLIQFINDRRKISGNYKEKKFV